MFVHPQFDPVAFSAGPLSIRWYGLAYLLGFALFWFLGRYRARQAWRGISIESVEDLLFYGMLGVIVGGRLGFCFFYQPQWFLTHPSDILKVWQGGMSAHGGMLGVIAAMVFYEVKTRTGFLRVADFAVPLVPLGLFFGRIGNFINGELWGRACDPSLPWAMIFPQSGTLRNFMRRSGKGSFYLFCCGCIQPSRAKPVPLRRFFASVMQQLDLSSNFSESPMRTSGSACWG